MIWNQKIECLGRKEMEQLQLARLKETIERVYHHVPFYRKRLDEIGMTPEKFTTLQDLQEIPFTTKEDIRQNYPYGLFAVPMKEVVRVHASSGTTGKPTVVGYTKNDLELWSEALARLITAVGGTAEDIGQVSFGYGLFTGAFGLHGGLEKIGATVVPMSSGNTEKQIMIMKDFQSTLLISTPSYAMYMAEVMEELGVKKEELHLRVGLFGSEASTPEMQQALADRLGILVTENYGLSEIMGPGVSGECYLKCGMHINEDYFIPEIIDSSTGRVLGEGERGEIVFTTVGKEAFPLLRYRTKDITSLDYSPCECGRTLARMDRIQGRSDDMMIIKGVNVFPSQIEGVLLGFSEISPNYQIILFKEGYFDAIKVEVELVDGSLLERFSELEALKKRIAHKIHTVLGLHIDVKLVEPKSITRFEGKAKRIVDKR